MDKLTNREFDAIVIGAGQGGKPLAVALANAGWQTALVEREHLGGTCVNVGCTPTKTMVASARVAYLARRGDDYGVRLPGVTVDMEMVRERKRKIVKSFRTGSEQLVKKTDGLALYRGEARFVESHVVDVALQDGSTVHLTAPTIVIDVGGRPSIPPIDGLDSVRYFDSTTIMELDHVPDHLIILGGGYIGLEFAQMFRRFGSRVTILERADQLMPNEDDDVASKMTEILSEDGIDIRLGHTVAGVNGISEHALEVNASANGENVTVTGSHLLIATGRRPNTDLLDLDAAGIETDKRGFIKVNAALETNVTGVYAIGDVKGGPAFTHISYDDYRVLERRLLKNEQATIDDRLVSYTIFTDPQLGRVGLSESQARSRGLDVKVALLPMSHVARALETDEPRGFMKAVVDATNGQILGCAIIGVEGGEIMNMLQIAMMGKLPYTALRDVAFAHPTFGESLNNLFATLD